MPIFDTLYARRYVENGDDIADWLEENGVEPVELKEPYHVTIHYARKCTVITDGLKFPERIQVKNDTRRLSTFRGGTPVLRFESTELQTEHQHLKNRGAVYDFPVFQPHISFLPAGNADALLCMVPYTGRIILGPIHMDELKASKR